ncbi:MAG: hypothetical protein BRD23_08655 [Halobacteriales archaeon SW_9_67_25]|nr:MAG: hypothetical protein BRD23_08655 [Halobacteriales archaeon SW_9_67_25]
MSSETADPTLSPTRTSTALAATVAVVTAGALVWRFSLVLAPTAAGVAGVVCVAAAVALAGSDRWETPGAVVASVLSVAAGAGILGGTLGSVLALVGAFFPVETVGAIPVRSVHLLARVGVVWGCLLVALGIALGVRNVADSESLSGYFGLAFRTGLVPLAAGGVLVAGTLLSRTPLDPVAPARTLLGALLSPAGGRTHLGSLLLLVAAAALAVRRAVAALPIAEFLADRGDGTTELARVEALLSRFDLVAGGAGFATGLAFLAEAALPLAIRRTLGPGPYRVLVALSTASAPRLLLAVLIVVSAATVALVASLRAVARGSPGGFLRRVGPYLGGGLVTALALVAGRPAVDVLLGRIVAILPGRFEAVFGRLAESVVAFYGPGTVAVGLVALLAWVTAAAVFALGLLLALGYLTETSIGYSLASTGLFAAAAFASAAGVDPWLAVAGLVAALFVWDVGRYGTVLGREVGRHSRTRGVELVHAGGTLAVGVGSALAALGLLALGPADLAGPSTPTALALVGAFAAVVALIAALR